MLAGKFLIGLYGNGFARRLMREQKPPLITYTWLSGFLGYGETIDVLKTANEWHLFQKQLDRTWFGACGAALDIDTNIQKPNHLEIGVWNKGGLFTGSAGRLIAIVEGRKVAKKAITLFESMNAHPSPSDKLICHDRKLTAQANPIGTRKPFGS